MRKLLILCLLGLMGCRDNTGVSGKGFEALCAMPDGVLATFNVDEVHSRMESHSDTLVLMIKDTAMMIHSSRCVLVEKK